MKNENVSFCMEIIEKFESSVYHKNVNRYVKKQLILTCQKVFVFVFSLICVNIEKYSKCNYDYNTFFFYHIIVTI